MYTLLYCFFFVRQNESLYLCIYNNNNVLYCVAVAVSAQFGNRDDGDDRFYAFESFNITMARQYYPDNKLNVFVLIKSHYPTYIVRLVHYPMHSSNWRGRI